MPTARVTNSLFDIQITMRTSQRPSVLQLVFALISSVPELLKRTLKALQAEWLKEDLGPPGSVGNLFNDGHLSCPECGRGNANRKDWKSRSPVVPVLGEIEVPQRRVTCQDCGSVYRPYKDVLGLPDHDQYTPEALLEGLRNVMVMSYEKAATFTRANVSANTLHRAIRETKPDIDTEDQTYALVIMDATDVPKWKKSGQITLTLAHEVSEGPTVHDRPTLNRTVVALAVGSEKDIKQYLEDPSIQGLMHDGKLDVEDLCEMEGRCWWHVPYTVKYLLYQDEIRGEENKKRVGWLVNILHEDGLEWSERKDQLEEWIEDNESSAPMAARHVENALEALGNVQTHPELFEVMTTSPMERQMPEVNKRFENGGGWTQEGAEALLFHWQLWMIEPETWLNNVVSNAGVTMPDFVQNSLI